MFTLKRSVYLLSLLCLTQTAQALHWQLTPPGHLADGEHAGHRHAPAQTNESRPARGGGMGRGGTQPWLSEDNGVEVSLWMPTPEAITLEGKHPQLPQMAPGHYQALVAIRKHPQGEDSAIHYLRLRSEAKPDLRGRLAFRSENRISPSDLTRVQKAHLEIVPMPLPRERHVYQEGMRADFEVRLGGNPLAGASVGLRSSNGSMLIEESDYRGQVRFIIPMDFKETLTDHQANPPAEMVLHTEYRDQGSHYATSLTMPYSPRPADRPQDNWALALLLAGMIGGGLLGRRVTTQTSIPGKGKISPPEGKA